MRRPGLLRDPLALSVAGYVVWAVSFVAIYGLQGIACEMPWSDGLRRGLLIGLWALFCALAAVPVALMRRTEMPGAWSPIGWAANLSALAATVWTGMPVLFATTCAA